MKKIVLLILVLKCFSVQAQSLTGIWQLNTPEVSSGYQDTYQFFSNGTFRFNTNQSDGLRRILSIGGKYKIEKSNIIFNIEYTIEIVGGSIHRDEITPGSDSWAIEGGQTKKISLTKSTMQRAILEVGKKDKGVDILLIDKRKYYKVDNDPDNFQ